jgi:hypothetical protein
MSINVYWACLEDAWLLAEQPESVSSKFYNTYTFTRDEPQSNINYCPAFNDNLKNLYSLKSIYDFNFIVDGDNVSTDKYDQKFFDDHVVIRSLRKKFFSFQHKYIFFTDSPSLKTTFYEYPFLEDNNITSRCIIPAGTFDIGRWFRNTEFAFFLKDGFNEFKITKGEVYSYVRFHTEESITFKQFRYTEKLDSYKRDCFQLTINPMKRLTNYYNNFKHKKLILREIQENLL